MPARERTSLPTVAPRSVAGVSLSEPPNVPIPVLRGVEMTISPLPLPLPKLTLYSFLIYLTKGYIKKARPGPPGPGLFCARYIVPPRRLQVGPPLHPVQVAPVVGEHGVQEVHVGSQRLLGQRLGGLLLLALLRDEIVRERPVVLGLRPQVVDDAVKEV